MGTRVCVCVRERVGNGGDVFFFLVFFFIFIFGYTEYAFEVLFEILPGSFAIKESVELALHESTQLDNKTKRSRRCVKINATILTRIM